MHLEEREFFFIEHFYRMFHSQQRPQFGHLPTWSSALSYTICWRMYVYGQRIVYCLYVGKSLVLHMSRIQLQKLVQVYDNFQLPLDNMLGQRTKTTFGPMRA